MIVKNSVIEWLDNNSDETRLERVLWIAPNQSYLYVFDIINWQKALPIRREYTEVRRALDENRARLKAFDGEYLNLPKDGYAAEQHIGRDIVTKNIIELLVRAQENEAIFIPKQRHSLINEIARRAHSSPSKRKTIYIKLRLLWRDGQAVNSLTPSHHRSEERGSSNDRPE